ncbi:sensor domain-containing protein [Pseudomarimonas arenosa]|uniref:EAL domain-containing protein n=1 Tax=Pseudomarimonas arenosa TaxID=2774145 RepID=A0AAW3ZMH8_9GAMM|nr:EAL domain-containing protein [Pseudomarimonas arenosa]MBD8525854.1 EAL domain-containing protein [Pseudomarimonas arenosa]
MDRVITHSLLQHPLPYALVLLDQAGDWLDGNAPAQRLLESSIWADLREPIEQAKHQLHVNADRAVRWQLDSEGASFDCLMTALTDDLGSVCGFSLSLDSRVEDPRDLDRRRAIDEVAAEELWDWKLDERMVRFPSPWHAAFGVGPESQEISIGDYFSRIHDDDRQAVQHAVAQYLRGRCKELRAEYRLRHADGRWRWVLARGHAQTWTPEGRVRRILGTHIDISGYKELEAQLRDREVLLGEAERLGDTGAWAWDPNSQSLWCSEGLYRITGLQHGHRLRDPELLFQLLSGDSREAFRKAFISLRVGGKPFNIEVDMPGADGAPRRLVARGEVIRDGNGHIERLIGVMHDITSRLAREESERIRNEMLDRVAQVGHIGGWEYNIWTNELRWTEENYRIHGIPVGKPVGIDSTKHMYLGHSREIFEAAVARMLNGERELDTIEVQFVTPDEERIWLRITGRLERRDGKPFRITGLTRDITAEREAGERIEQLAHYDTLTGLPNRFQFRELAATAVAAARRSGSALALMFLDLDRFKHVNDTLGHEAGDQLLLDVAGRIRAAVRSGDVVARQSGDEFLVLLRELKRVEDAGRVAQKIIDAVNQPVLLGDTGVSVGASIGIAVLNDNTPTLEQLMRAADTAMYAAKEGGRNSYAFYSDAFFEQIQRKATLEQELRQALTRNEFYLAYQPTIDLADGRVRGIETLLRWIGPSGDPRSPAEFIPIAEDCGEIIPIGRWVLEQACRQARKWDQEGIPFERIAVNVSAIQLRDSEFGAMVIDTCQKVGWAPERLELELTESALMRDSEVLRRTFALLETHGVSLSVDDFGTGFSNLHYLHRFPVRHLKIDRSFVFHLFEDPAIERISEAIVGLAHALRLRVVAEGVETDAARKRLREIGCDEAQGYLFSRPLGAREFEAWVRTRKAG